MDYGRRDILKFIEANGGRAYVDKCKLPHLSCIGFYLEDLCDIGDIKEEGDKVYSLTEKGRKRVLEENYTWTGYGEKRNKNLEEAEWL